MSTGIQRIDAECRETERLTQRAWRLGVEVPDDRSWWEDNVDELVESGARPEQIEMVVAHWLSPEGKARFTFLIEEAEARKADEQIDRRNKRLVFYSQIVTMIVGLGGVLIGIIEDS